MDPLPALSDWSIAAATRAGADWFRHTLILDVVPTSVRYLMQIDGAPEGVQVYINGHFIGKTQHRRAFNADVTDWLVSPRNVIALKIAQHEGRGGAFGRLRLQPVPAGF